MFLNEYLRKEYNEKVYKLSFDAGATCPTRDGKICFGGCAFCSDEGSGDFALKITPDTVDEAIEAARSQVGKKADCRKYIIYFQSHTNTYFDDCFTQDYFGSILEKAVQNPLTAVIDIGTRADCIDEKTIQMLSEINEIKPVWVEIGLQTIHDSTRERLDCGFTLDDFERAYNLLQEARIKTIIHMIVGLPQENEAMILETADYISRKKPFGIKIQLLHVLRNTKLADIYKDERFYTLSPEEYTDMVAKIVKMMPEEVVIHRMTGDGPKDKLIAPMWSTDKKRVLNMINAKLM